MSGDGTAMTIEEALAIFQLEQPVTSERVEERYHTLRHTWHPPRYANMTNNPKTYMKMYLKAQAMLKDVETAYRVLASSLEREGTTEGH